MSLPAVGVRVGDGFEIGRGPGMVVRVGEYWVEWEKVDGAFERSGRRWGLVCWALKIQI